MDKSVGVGINKELVSFDLKKKEHHWSILVEYGSAQHNNPPWNNTPYRGVLFTRKYYALSVM